MIMRRGQRRMAAVRTLLAGVLLAMTLAGCQATPVEAPVCEPAPPAPAEPPPAPAALPDTTPEQVRDDFDQVLRQASAAWERGDHQSALLFYERVLGRAGEPRDQVRALIGMAALRLVPASTVADATAAAVVMRELDLRLAEHELHHEYFVQRELLRLLQAREGEMRALRESNRKLAAQLAAKDALVRQLRALSVDGD